MKELHMLHGCVSSWRRHVQSARNYVPEHALRRHLDARTGKYGALSDAFDCDGLTIDDSTRGAARACVIAREAGHEVTLFVNPAHVVHESPYWFSRFDTILDERRVTSVTFEGHEFEISQARSLRAFRLAVKARLMALSPVDADRALDELAVRLRASTAIVPEYARTLTLEMLRGLVEVGVRVESHGWDHRDIVTMRPEELVEDLRLTRRWFQECLGFTPAHYAVPYGLVRLPPRAAQEVSGMILLAHPELESGDIGDGHWNRRDITLSLQSGIT